jgi:hypothetical protein
MQSVRRRGKPWACVGCLLLVALAGRSQAGAVASACSQGPVPAATLLIPYFEVDLTADEGQTTLFAVTNAGDHDTLAHVVLWTDWGVPTLAFDLFLGANDLQSVNLRDLFAGVLPATGGGSFAGCTNPLTLPSLDAAAVTRLRRQHTGQPDAGNDCSGSSRGGTDVAVGYVTVDVAQACSATIVHPHQAGYFVAGGSGIASNENLLVGDFFYVDSAENFAQGSEAVHIVADTARFGEQPATFYGAWIGETGDDARAPLPTRHRARYLNGGAFDGGTDLVVWMEPGIATPEALPCGERSQFVDICQYLRLTAVDEGAQAEDPFHSYSFSEVTARIPVGGDEIPVAAPFGFVDFENRSQFGCVILPFLDFPLQSWVMPMASASGRFSVGWNASRVGDELCPPAAP